MNKKMLEALLTSELDEMLQDELHQGAPDGDLVRQIIWILEGREKDYPVEVTPQIQAALDKFEDHGRAERPRPTARSWVMKAAPAAAIICLLICVVPMQASAETWWERIARWTESVFEFVIDGEADAEKPEYVFQTDNPRLQEVYDAITELGVTVPVVPMWIPEGYELVACEKQTSAENANVIAVFSDEESQLVYRAYYLDIDTENKYQKDREDIIEYELCGVVHNMMHNNDLWTVAWMNGRIECVLSVKCAENTLYKIISSIYTTEDIA